MSQELALKEIAQRHPELRSSANKALATIEQKFGTPLNLMDKYIHEQVGPSWIELRENSRQSMLHESDANLSDKIYARRFIDLVGDRNAGNIPAKTLGPLLVFHPKYYGKPQIEMLDGYIEEHQIREVRGARNLSLSFKAPVSWKKTEPFTPGALVAFTSAWGQGSENFEIYAARPDGDGVVKTIGDVEELIQSGKVKKFTQGATIPFSQEPILIDGKPTLLIRHGLISPNGTFLMGLTAVVFIGDHEILFNGAVARLKASSDEMAKQATPFIEAFHEILSSVVFE